MSGPLVCSDPNRLESSLLLARFVLQIYNRGMAKKGPKQTTSRRQHRRPLPRRRQNSNHQPPGVLLPPADALQSSIRIIAYNATELRESTPKNFTELKENLSKNTVNWIDIVGQADTELFGQLRDHFQLHPLALEDALTNYQRPKIEDFEEFSHIVVRMPNLREGLYFEQVSLIWGKGYVITVQEK